MAAAVFTPEEHIAHLPLYATPKIDGIRFYVQDGVVWSRSNKPIRNVHIQRFIPLLLPSGCDGEFLVGESSAEDHFQQTSSVVMSDDKPINGLHTFVFDRLDPSILHVPKYSSRIAALLQWRKDHAQIFLAGRFVCHTSMDVSTWQEYDINSTNGAILYNLHQNITVLRPVALRKPADIDTYLTRCLSQGYEGIMLRRPDGGYKFGRATSKQAWLLKHKPLEDSEAIVIGFEELMRNENEAFKNEVGHTKRSTSIAGKIPGGTLGSFQVHLQSDPSVAFSIGGGIGLDTELRQQVWNNRPDYVGRIIKFSYLKCGTKTLPRQPKFLGFRDQDD